MGNAKRRRERRSAEQQERTDKALSITCPVCGANPGVWCKWDGLLGPSVHERRWGAVK